MTRGNVQITLSTSASAPAMEAVVNETALEAVIDLVNRLATGSMRANQRSMAFSTSVACSNSAIPNSPRTPARRDEAVLAGFMKALEDLKDMRLVRRRGPGRVLGEQIDRIEELTFARSRPIRRAPPRRSAPVSPSRWQA
jgi:uncharacterized protein YicC (UPF0701 family)